MPGAVLSISRARLSQGTILTAQTHRKAAKQESEPSGSHPPLKGGWSRTSQRRSARRISKEPKAGPRSIPPWTLKQPAMSSHGAAAPSAGQKFSTTLPSSSRSARSTRPSGSQVHVPPACHRSLAPRTTPPPRKGFPQPPRKDKCLLPRGTGAPGQVVCPPHTGLHTCPHPTEPQPRPPASSEQVSARRASEVQTDGRPFCRPALHTGQHEVWSRGGERGTHAGPGPRPRPRPQAALGFVGAK